MAWRWIAIGAVATAVLVTTDNRNQAVKPDATAVAQDSERLYSPIARIDAAEPRTLGLAWSIDMAVERDVAEGNSHLSSLQQIVSSGAPKADGMVTFASVVSAAEIETVRQYAIKRANENKVFGATM